MVMIHVMWACCICVVLCCVVRYLPVELAVVDHGQHTEGLDLHTQSQTHHHTTPV
jgi:hypothetical protein